MNLFLKKIPRGIIYHKVSQSFRYLIHSLMTPLDDGQAVARFERAFADYCGTKHCVIFPFARTAVYFALKNLDLPKGSEVILPPVTIKGIVDVVVELGLLPLYVDFDVQTINFREDELRRKINPKVKAAIITPLFGLVPNMESMVKLLKQQGIFVIEDFSQSLNGRYEGKPVGTFGDLGIYSSSSIKTLDTLGGGLAVTNNEKIYQGLRTGQAGLDAPQRSFLVKKAWVNLIRNIATSQPFFTFLTFPLLQIIRKLNPESALKQTGHRNKDRLKNLPRLWFCRYTSLQAKIGLEHIDEVTAEDRVRIANVEFIKSNCGPKNFPGTTPASGNVYWQLIFLVPNALDAQTCLARQGVDSATSSLELVCALKDYPNQADCPNAERIYHNGIFIPCFPNLNQSDLKRIVSAVQQYFREYVDGR